MTGAPGGAAGGDGGAGLVEAGRMEAGLVDRMVALRRDIHAHPETAWQERRTTGLVAAALEAAGLRASVLPVGTGLVCDVRLGPGEGGPVVALRADLDALPIADDKSVPYRSRVAGVAHACGHDAHTAVVLGAGLALAGLARAGQVGGPGTVRLIFQPAEEVLPGGALSAIDAGALDGVQRVFAVHCDPHFEAGTVGLRAGAVTGATDSITVRLSGPGGHTARPQLTVDVVSALAEVLARAPAVLSRRVDPRAGCSLVWGRVSAGRAANVIPEAGEAAGSVRVLDRDVWGRLDGLLDGIVRQIAAPYGGRVEVDYVRGVPPAVNDRAATESLRAVATGLLGAAAVREAPQSMGGEDFAWMLDLVPGALCRLGVRPPGTEGAPDLHRGAFDIDESAIGTGIGLLSAAAAAALAELG